MYNLFRLIRANNLAMIVITMFLIRYCVVKPILSGYGIDLQMSGFWFTILVLSTVLMAAGGYAINDYFDTKTDSINRPDRVLVGKTFSRLFVIQLHLMLSIAGAVLGVLVAMYVRDWRLALIFPLVGGLLWFYSTTYKGMLVIGNLVISFLVGVIPFVVLMFDLAKVASVEIQVLAENMRSIVVATYWVSGFAIFAFLTNFIREVVKDVEDYEGDVHAGRVTLPITWGVANTKLIAGLLVLIEAVSIAVISFRFLGAIPAKDIQIVSVAYILFLLIIPLTTIVGVLLFAASKKNFSRASLLIKLVMLAGILYSPLFCMAVRTIFNHKF